MLDVAEPLIEAQAQVAARVGEDAFSALRLRGLERFTTLGLPTRKHEDWRYTNVSRLKTTRWESPEGTDFDATATGYDEVVGLCARRMVFVNGRFSPAHSDLGTLPEGLRVASLDSLRAAPSAELVAHLGAIADASERPFVALNEACLEDGAVVQVAPGTVVKEPLALIFVATGGLSNLRNVVLVGQGAELSVVEAYVGSGESFTNVVTEVALGANAGFEHAKLQEESLEAVHIAELHVHQERDSRLRSHSYALGGDLVRNAILARLDAPGGDCAMHGLYLVRGKQHVDNHTAIDHRKPHCNSAQIYKGILGDDAVAVFDGKVFVRPDAQKTTAEQSNKNLLLSDKALVHTKPELQILADDVRCHHGATVGQLDEDALFYLRSRGLGAELARRTLTYAFASDIVAESTVPALRERLEAHILARLDFEGES